VPVCRKLPSVLVQALFSSLQQTIGFEHYFANQESFTGIVVVVKTNKRKSLCELYLKLRR